MKTGCMLLLCIVSSLAYAQENISPFDGRFWGVVLEHPGTKQVAVKENIEYVKFGDRSLHMDVYLPPGIADTEARTTIVLLNGIGDQPGQNTMKSSPAHTSWSRLLAANGYVVVTMETATNKVHESFTALFGYLAEHGGQLHVDINKIGVQAFSANCRESVSYLMGANVFPGIKGAVFYYGEVPTGPFREDLPVLFVVAELDIRGNNYSKLWQEVLKTNAPWTITIGRDMPHAFDFFSDSEISQRLIMSTISFWNDQLGLLPERTQPFSKEREIIASRYDRNQSRMVKLMGEWMRAHPDSQDSYALSAYGSALMDSQEFAEAEKYLRKATAIEPKNKGNYLMLTVVCYAQGKTKEGAASLATYEKDSTPEGFTYSYIANRLFYINKYMEASALYERALTFPDKRSYLFYNLAACYVMLGEKDKAFKNLSIAVEQEFGTKADYEADEKFKDVRGDSRWNALMEKMK